MVFEFFFRNHNTVPKFTLNLCAPQPSTSIILSEYLLRRDRLFDPEPDSMHVHLVLFSGARVLGMTDR